MINIRQKGGDAERQVATDLNVQIYIVFNELGLDIPGTSIVQRNQNQSAVGGQDLVGTFGFAIEVKRQEQLSINTWWNQCVKSAKDLKEIPVLLFRQSKCQWRCILESKVQITDSASVTVRSEISYDDFKAIFREKVRRSLLTNPQVSKPEEGLFPI